MSDALNYLVKARPDAVGHYFAFLKACGTQLDPKTRNLISVISKVHAQTERGFRQYLGRALREGCNLGVVQEGAEGGGVDVIARHEVLLVYWRVTVTNPNQGYGRQAG